MNSNEHHPNPSSTTERSTSVAQPLNPENTDASAKTDDQPTEVGLPVLPLRGETLFPIPDTVHSFVVGRARSVTAIEEALKEKGHKLQYQKGIFGGYQAIMIKDGVYFGASESRKDGQASGY